MVGVDATDIDGFLKLYPDARQRILSEIDEDYGSYSEAAEELEVPGHYFYNYSRSDQKLHTSFVKVLSARGFVDSDDFKAFYDDKGSSSTPYVGDFPIVYSPRWHFVLCLCIGDGYFNDSHGRQFCWYQKEEGVKAIIDVVRDMGFEYNPSFDSPRHGIVFPQLIRKVAEQVLDIGSKEEAFNRIIDASRELGEEYEIALLTAFFVDEAGISTGKRASEITIHQEGDLDFLEEYGSLLNDFDVRWNKNRKGDYWVIRITNKGVRRLNEVFARAESLGFGLLHRREAFDQKVSMAEKTKRRTELRKDTTRVRNKILEKDCDEYFTVEDVLPFFDKERNVERRARELLRYLEKDNRIKKISDEEYCVIS